MSDPGGGRERDKASEPPACTRKRRVLMHTHSLLTGAAIWLVVFATSGLPTEAEEGRRPDHITMDFEQVAVGMLPTGFSTAVTGERTQFAGVNIQVPSRQWQTLMLEVQGAHFRVFLNNRLLFEAGDTAFKDAGKVGFWTKADSVTYFDDLRIKTGNAR
jgi:hypothetical protein